MLKVNKNNIKQTLNNYELGELLLCKKISIGYSNTNFKIVTNTGSYIYRICQRQPLALIHYEIELMKALKQIDFPAAFPVRRQDGEYLSLENNECIIIYDFIQGNQPEINTETVTEIASIVAKLNCFKAWEKLPNKNPINIDRCHQIIQSFETSRYKFLDIFEYFIEQTKYLSKYLTEEIPKGIVHGDIFPDNTIFNGDQLVAIIDFEFASLDYLIMDVSIAINGFCFLNNRLDKNLLTLFLHKYNRIRRFTKRELDLLPYYIQWGTHRIILCHLEHRLLQEKTAKQLSRVQELIERVKILRESESAVCQIIQDFARS